MTTSLRLAVLCASTLVAVACSTAPIAQPSRAAPSLRIVSERAAAAVTFEPKTYVGDWTQLTFVTYPAGAYSVSWTVKGLSPAGRPEACHITLALHSSIPQPGATPRPVEDLPIASRDVAAGTTDTGSATVTVKGGDYDLLIDGAGCEWSVSVAAG